ncbi:hypothetical protein MuYL_2110 [Mucilaginibacter xinganensis]|uniref:Uncharacterized protein n=1 Tax=Mucilaginibacter xinganensis TaxID=1234841 RepID=A0A223NW52_9SPHI|nr:hypothetical protein MuYL_2110 [Mucilaginibacter xinganensis]
MNSIEKKLSKACESSPEFKKKPFAAAEWLFHLLLDKLGAQLN